jgi:Flp pilus assembly protein protease CpaA
MLAASHDFDIFIWCLRFGLAMLLLWVLFADTNRRKIPNLACVIILSAGLLFNSFASSGAGLMGSPTPGAIGFKQSFTSVFVVFVFVFFLFALKLWGAGDAKLVIALSSWLHLREVGVFILLLALSGGVLAIGRIIFFGNGAEVLSGIKHLALARFSGVNPVAFKTADRMPFSWAIVSGFFILSSLSVFKVV